MVSDVKSGPITAVVCCVYKHDFRDGTSSSSLVTVDSIDKDFKKNVNVTDI